MKTKRNRKYKIPYTVLEMQPCASAHIRITNYKYNCDELELAKEERWQFLYRLLCSMETFLIFVFYLNV